MTFIFDFSFLILSINYFTYLVIYIYLCIYLLFLYFLSIHNLCLCIYRFNFLIYLTFSGKKDASRLFNLVFCFNNFTLYAIDFSEERIEMVFSWVD